MNQQKNQEASPEFYALINSQYKEIHQQLQVVLANLNDLDKQAKVFGMELKDAETRAKIEALRQQIKNL